MKTVGKTPTPFTGDLNQIPYNYTAEVRNRPNGLDLIECVKNYGQRFVILYRRQGSRQPPGKRNIKRKNGLSEDTLQIAEKKRDTTGKREKEDIPI